jgi:RimJ/RimL family protein N-acetyltransferase
VQTVSAAPVIRKAAQIRGHTLVLRNATEADAAFIVGIRTHPAKRRFISPTSSEVSEQVAWLRRYANASDQAYFVAEDLAGHPSGTVRIYDAIDDSFCFGSWLTREGAPLHHAVEALLIIYRYAMDVLGFNRSYFAVRHDNRSVWRFMERFGGIRTRSEGEDYWYETQRAAVEASFQRHAELLPSPIQVKGMAA